jgi:hypothetical protein
MSVTASATKFDAVKRLTWATMKLITVCRSERVRSIVGDEDLKLASPAIQRHAPRFKRHQQRPPRCVDSKHDLNKSDRFENSSNKVTAIADLRTNAFSNCTKQHCAFKLFLGATCYSSALDAEAFRSSHG